MKNEEMKNEEVISNEEIRREQIAESREQLFSNSEQLNFEIAETEQGTEIIVREQGKETTIKTTAKINFNKAKRQEEVKNEEVKSEEIKIEKTQEKTSIIKNQSSIKEKQTDNGRNTRWAILWGGIVLFVGMLMNWDRIFKR